jgi:superfamily II DNA or RNA helicase
LAPKPWKRKAPYQTIYSKYVVENEQRNDMVIKGAIKLVEQGFPTLVLFHSLKHGEILKTLLSKDMPIGCLSGKDSQKERNKVKDQLESGKIKCVIASKIFDIGVDLPILSGLVIAGAGKSSVRALQRIGRVIRPYPGKKMAAVLDFADQASYLDEHAETRCKVYSQEFNVKWPQEKIQK